MGRYNAGVPISAPAPPGREVRHASQTPCDDRVDARRVDGRSAVAALLAADGLTCNRHGRQAETRSRLCNAGNDGRGGRLSPARAHGAGDGDAAHRGPFGGGQEGVGDRPDRDRAGDIDCRAAAGRSSPGGPGVAPHRPHRRRKNPRRRFGTAPSPPNWTARSIAAAKGLWTRAFSAPTRAP